MRQFIYVIAESTSGPCKIGITTDPRFRLSILQNGNPRKLTLAHYKQINYLSRLEYERVAHALAGAAYQLVGEWFDITTDSAVRAVDEACRMMDEPGWGEPAQVPMINDMQSSYHIDMNEQPKTIIRQLKPPSALYMARREAQRGRTRA